MVLTGEQNLETPGLGVDEQAGSGVQVRRGEGQARSEPQPDHQT